MKNLKIILSILLCLPAIFNAEASLYRTYQTGDGLSHNSVWAVMQDRQGFLWFGTNDGLNRFDGLKFKVFRREDGDTLSIGNNFIHCLLESPEGHIYVGTKEGLYEYNPSTENFAHVNLDNQPYGKDRNSIHQLLYDSEGNLWVGCYGQGIFKINKASGEVTHYSRPALPSNSITAMVTDQQGNLWVGTDNVGMYRINTKTGKIQTTSVNNCNVQTLYRQNNSAVWVGTATSGLLKYDPRSDSYTSVKEAQKGLSLNDIKALTPYNSTAILMSSEDGVLILELNSDKISKFDDTSIYDNLYDKSIFSIAVDKEGAIWLGSYFNGVSYWSPRINSFAFNPLSVNTQNSNIVKNFAVAPDKKVVFTSKNEGITLFDPEKRVFSNFKVAGLSNNIQFAMPKGADLWISDYGHGLKIVSYPSGTMKQQYTTKDGLPSNIINTVCHTSRGISYIGTPRGTSEFDGQNFKDLPELKNAAVMTILEDFDGNIWFATHFYGIFKKTPDGEYTNYSTLDSSLPGNNINNIFLDSKGMLWVGTEGEGLVLFNPNSGTSERKFSESTGLPSDIIYSTQEDANGDIWVATGGGLIKISKDTYELQDFKYIENLLNIHYAHNASMALSSHSRILFGGSGGFISIDPSKIERNDIAPVIRIIDLTVKGSHRPLPDEKLKLESYESTFGMDVACLSYLSPEQNTISYRLKGFDKEWKTLTGYDRHIEYMNLPWGNYTLEIKGANNDGVWSEPWQMPVEINRPWLMSNWMLAIYAVLLIVGLWLAKKRFDYVQKRKMVDFSHAKEKELYEAKIGFFTNIAHEIRTPLSLISAPLETILASGDGNSRTRHNLEVMKSNVQRLLELINQLLDFRKVEAQLMRVSFQHYNVSQIVTDICSRYEEFAHLNMIEINTSGITPDVYCNLDKEAFEKIVGNLMSNATKFANRHINVILHKDASEKNLILEVVDDGPGVKEKDLEKIFESFYQVDDHGKHPGSGLGLPLARRLAELHDGTLKVVSVYGKGCKFILTIPTTLEAGEIEAKEKEKTSEEAINNETVETKSPEKPLILIVEDNDELRKFIADNLDEKYTVATASNGVEAIKTLEKKPADLIVSDIMMPDMDGIELCRAVRSNRSLDHIPIVLLSAKTDVETKVEGLNIGANAYIEKPFSVEQLKAQIKSILEARRKLQASLMQSPLDYYKLQHSEDSKDTENAEFVTKLNDLILEHLNDPEFNIDSVAREFAMSRSSFHSKVKAITGETPNNYIRIIRLSKAAEYLATGKYQIVEVCYMVGFNTPSYFSKCFSEYFGKLPKEYINELTNTQNN